MHDLTQTIIDENTLEITSVNSYIFTCPICNKQARYAYSFNDNIEVFCDGQDFGTKMLVNNVVFEISNALFMQEAFTDGLSSLTAPQELIDVGLVELVNTDYVLTEVGKQVMQELNNG